MRGNVIGFDPDTNTGAISGHDGRRYDFVTLDWRGASPPQRGDLVDFQPAGSRAAHIYLIEPEYVRPSFGQFYFSPWGRISRSEYWLRGILPIWGIWWLLLIAIIAASATGGPFGAGLFSSVWGIYSLAIIWPGMAVLIKRIHDRDKTGWLILLPLIPKLALYVTWGFAVTGAIIAAFTHGRFGAGFVTGASTLSHVLMLVLFVITIWFFVEFGCLRGTIGGNRFGPDPIR